MGRGDPTQHRPTRCLRIQSVDSRLLDCADGVRSAHRAAVIVRLDLGWSMQGGVLGVRCVQETHLPGDSTPLSTSKRNPASILCMRQPASVTAMNITSRIAAGTSCLPGRIASFPLRSGRRDAFWRTRLAIGFVAGSHSETKSRSAPESLL